MTQAGQQTFALVEASIADLRGALDAGTLSSVELVALYLKRVAHYDRGGIALNAVPILNDEALEEAAESDRRRAAGASRGPLEGIPFTVKDSFKVAGMTVEAGSHAFEGLMANEDAFVVARLRAAGAVVLGRTNMPPMAAGGMQRGLYGRAESPYNADYLTAAFASGSSNGSGTSTAASFAAFSLAEETVSSGRSPASNNGLVAYTPSRGMISMRGNWPLFPTCDVVVPYTRSVTDMFAVLDAIVADDPETEGDFWRAQEVVPLPRPSAVRPTSYAELADPSALAGRRIGVPKMFIGTDDAGAFEPIVVRNSIVALWARAAEDLEALGATVVEVDFPVVSNYDKDRPGAESMFDRGLVPDGWTEIEMHEMIVRGWDEFLAANGEPGRDSLAQVDGSRIFVVPPGALPGRHPRVGTVVDYLAMVETAKAGSTPFASLPGFAQALRGLERTREVDFEDWLDASGLDLVVFPANADVGRADADADEASADAAWRNGVLFSNGNRALRHLGIPSVTVCMGVMGDIGMPVGLTFAGKAYDDNALLRYAFAYEQATARREPPPRTPPLEGENIPRAS